MMWGKKLAFFVVFLMIISIGLWMNSRGAYADGSYSFDLEIHVKYSVGDCEAKGAKIACKFYIKPNKTLDKYKYSGNPPGQDLLIDVKPGDDYGMQELRDKYLGYWYYSNGPELSDIQNLEYTLSIDKSKLSKKEDTTAITYEGNVCFNIDLHWQEYGSNSVIHGITGFCRSISIEEKKLPKFEGKSTVSSTTTGWVNKNASKILYITGCKVTGCKINFSHSLKRSEGYGSSDYSITRTSNYLKGGVNNGTLKKGEEKFSGGDEKEVYSEQVKLVPGQVVCEEMKFKINSKKEYRKTKVCVMVLGEVSTFINQKVANKNIEKYKEMQEEVFAKPGDRLVYETVYDPALQYAYHLSPERMQINSGSVSTPDSEYSSFGKAFNKYKDDDLGKWKSSFSVSVQNIKLSKDYKYNVGNDYGEKKVVENEYAVTLNDVGKNLDAKAETNLNDETKTTPSKIKFSKYYEGNDSYYNLGTIYTDGISDTAKVKVPFNFSNQTKVTSADNVVYAGEKASIAYEITTSPKQSIYFNDSYATIVKEAKWKVEVCYGENYEVCHWSEEKKGNLHENNGIYEKSVKSDNSTSTIVDVPDVPAGTKIRVRSAVYPAASSSKLDGWSDKNGNNTWAYSDPVELTVAKKPSFQVWGGSVYSAGELNIPISIKNNLVGITSDYPYNYTGGNKNRVFGSWTELSLVANGNVRGLASGAGIGYKTTEDAINHAAAPGDLGGSNSDNYCDISTLSFPNSNCNKNSVGRDSIQASTSSDRSSLVSRFNDENSEEYALELKNIDTTIGNIEMTEGTKVIKAENNTITINNNLTYDDNATYDTLESIPKLIIYANNININCNVTRIDAVLIANENINTCADVEDINAQVRSTQLIINGATISNTLTLGRTYGAATGNNSIIPAEIINYDTSLFLWSNKQSSATSTGKLTEASRIELSPRY